MVFSSLAIAVFWGGNLGTVYPIVDVVLKDRSLRTWIDENIQSGNRNIAEWQTEIESLSATIGNKAPSRPQTKRLAYLNSR